MNSLRVAVRARVCLCVGDSMCVASPGVSYGAATPNPEGFCHVGNGNNWLGCYSCF